MSEATAKAARRDLRRVIGEEALDDLAQLERTVQGLANSLKQAHERIDKGDTREYKRWDATSAEVGRLHRLEAVCAPLHHATIWRRLRWLVTGR